MCVNEFSDYCISDVYFSYNVKMTLNSVNNLNGVLNYLCSYFAIY